MKPRKNDAKQIHGNRCISEAPLAPEPSPVGSTPEPQVDFGAWIQFFGRKRDGSEFTPAEKAQRALEEQLQQEARDAEPLIDRTPFYLRSYTRDI